MASFNFRLDPVLRFRGRVKEEKQWELAALNATRRQMEEQIRALEDEAAALEQNLDGEAGQLFSAVELRLRGEYAQSLERRIRARQKELAAFDETVVAKRLELVEAMRAVKTLEQLRKRLEEKFRYEEGVEQQKFADEIAQRKFTDPETRKKLP